MGNENSSPLDSPLSRNNSGTTYDRAKVARKFSSSPPRPRNGSLSSNITTPHSAQQIRRAKTCRIKDRSSARRTVCSVTGLTIHQKALLTRKWNRMDKSTIHELGRRVFEGVFEESPNALIYIGLKDEPNWKTSITFRMHVQRFVCALTETMRRMKEPNSACDILRDFGAGYVQEREKKRVPATFFEKLANALNDAARQLQESDHLTIERARSVSADDPSESSSEGGGKSDTMTSSTTVLSDQFRPSICSPVGMSNTYSSPSFLQRSDGSDRHPSSSSSSSPICPITSEAWLVFAVFVANQIKFGYELERVLQGEMSKLGLSNVPKKSFIESQHSTEIALFN